MTNFLLYALTVFTWGASWLAIKFQLGVVAPGISIVYRMGISAALLLVFCLIVRKKLRFKLEEHAFMALQGLFLFSTNYFLIYLGTQYLTSGLVAVVFSILVIFNIIGSAILFKTPIQPRVVAGAAFGMCGMAVVFWPEITAFDLSRDGTLGLVLTLAGTLLASLGMLTSARNQMRGLPVVQTNAYGMAYGTAFITVFSLLQGSSFNFDPSFPYVASLLYLAVFASVIGFGSYLTLLGRIGAGRAAYASVLFPIVALGLSTLFEGYQWTPAAIAGVALVLLGNTLVLTRSKALEKPAVGGRQA